MRFSILCLMLLFLAGPVMAGAPMVDTYESFDLPGGSFYTGHFSESWVGSPPNAGYPGNTINAASWDGATLGAEWHLDCAYINAPPIATDNRDGSGTGTVEYDTYYDGGMLTLKASGPWGDEDYDVTVDYFKVRSTHLYFNNVLQNVVSDVTIFGSFTGYINCMAYTIANAAIYGNTPQDGALPAGFPAFTDGSCNAGPQDGAWGATEEITLVIYPTCEVGTEQSSWGAVKARY